MISVSASSAAGSLSRDDARRRRSSARPARRAARSAGRRRTRRPRGRRSSRPARRTSPGRGPRAPGSAATAAACGSPPTAGVGCSSPRELEHARPDRESCARIGVPRCWMLAIRTRIGSSACVIQTACGRSARSIRLTTICCSSRSLAERRSCSPRWSSTDGIGAAARRAGEGERSGPQALAADEQLGAGREERRRRRGRPQRTWQDGNASRRTPRTAAASCAVGAWTWTSRASTTLAKRPARISSTARATAALVVLGRHRADDARAAAGRVGIPQRAAPGRDAAPTPGARSRAVTAAGSSSGRARAASVSRTSPPRRTMLSSRHVQRGGGKAGPVRRCARRAGRRQTRRVAIGPEPATPSGGSQTALGGQRPPALGERPEALGRRSPPARATQPSVASAAPSRSGCSSTVHGSPGRREATTAAVGSAPAGERRP